MSLYLIQKNTEEGTYFYRNKWYLCHLWSFLIAHARQSFTTSYQYTGLVYRQVHVNPSIRHDKKKGGGGGGGVMVCLGQDIVSNSQVPICAAAYMYLCPPVSTFASHKFSSSLFKILQRTASCL